MNYKNIFNQIKPDFFPNKEIQENKVFTELIMDLHKKNLDLVKTPYPDKIIFDFYKGDSKQLHNAVALVNKNWIQYFDEKTRTLCAFDSNKIVAFCIVDDMGKADGLRIGGPGCVGTIPEYRKKGIGLELVRRATEWLFTEGYDISWIHWTHIEDWYRQIGYEPVLKWNCKGFVEMN